MLFETESIRETLCLIVCLGVTSLLALLLSNCAGSFTVGTSTSGTQTLVGQQDAYTQSLQSTRVDFFHANFYSLTSPNPATGCAGDANTYYDPLNLSNNFPVAYPSDVTNSSTTVRPSFIKNISVDMTDAGTPSPANLASGCSFGSGLTGATVSNCATFDYGAINGFSSTLSGSLLMVGGIQSANMGGDQCGPVMTSFSGGGTSTISNVCNTSTLALGLNTPIPGLTQGSSQGTTSLWLNLAAQPTYSGPGPVFGLSSSYNDSLRSLLVFGGVTTSGISFDTWNFNAATQQWTFSNGGFFTNPTLLRVYDSSVPANPVQLSKVSGGRQLFGYVPLYGMAIDHLSTDGLVSTTKIDDTDRIIIVGGVCGNTATGVCSDTLKFNPTFGPEYFDVKGASPPSGTPSQWIDSYPVQVVSNSDPTTQLIPNNYPDVPIPAPIPSPTPTAYPALANRTEVDAGIIGFNNNDATLSGGFKGAGYLMSVGGFFGNSDTNADTNNPTFVNPNPNPLPTPSPAPCLSNTKCGGMKIQAKFYGTTYSQTVETTGANFTAVTNYNTVSGTEATPAQWFNGTAYPFTDFTPWFGGGSFVNGFDLSRNEVVFFGGADCRSYLTNSSSTCNVWPTPGNPGVYWRLGTNPLLPANIDPTTTVNEIFDPANSIAYTGGVAVTTGSYNINNMVGCVPKNAGMATARGLDSAGNPVIVAWGGMIQPGGADQTQRIYYLYKGNTTNGYQPVWDFYVPTGSNTPPVGRGAASLVFSHVTGKFYLFGGYSGQTGTNSDIWELSITGTAPTTTLLGASTSNCTGFSPHPYSFTWRLLAQSTTQNAGLTCYPSCPAARSGQRMVEANYNHQIDSTTFEPVCNQPNSPCSFGIFMEGGSTGGTNVLTDRYMFDPTANATSNGNFGHWQLVNDFPPRAYSMMSTADYAIPFTNLTAHRAILFGGETGMRDLKGITNGNYYVPPTLGDTWMYDFATTKWSRVSLYGARYPVSSVSGLSEVNARAGHVDTDATTAFAPPPLAGGVMVTRTFNKQQTVNGKPTQLAIPEIFLFGGRDKYGRLNPLNNVYKFCSGSTGEKPYPSTIAGRTVPAPDDASCDAYDPTTNPSSPSPISDTVGAWLTKNVQINLLDSTTMDPSSRASYLGAATYDSSNDVVVLYGGLTAISPASIGITNSVSLMVSTDILEYTPPSSANPASSTALLNGVWRSIPLCTGKTTQPTGRYGHSLSYDSRNKTLIMVGGYGIAGNLLTQTQTTSTQQTYTIPEVWNATRGVDSVTGNPCYSWTQITNFTSSVDLTIPATPTSGMANFATAFIASDGYQTGFYSMFDDACAGVGPVISADSSVSKLLAGGAYIDIDRTQLDPSEDLVLNLTFIPFNTNNTKPDNSFYSLAEEAIFKIHLLRTGLTGDALRQIFQPRYLTFTDSNLYPEIAQNISIVAPPNGQIRQEQVVIPLSIDPTIDRIRIERYSGSGILIDASVYRLGRKAGN